MQSLQKNETIVVTGASGLLGFRVLKQLATSDARIIAVCRNIPETIDHRVEWQSCDVLDIIALENIFTGVDKIYHCAGLVSYDPRRKKEIFDINVYGTANVINAALNKGVKRLLHVSSVASMGVESKENELTDESTAWKEIGASDYSKSKHLAEMEVWRGLSEGLSTIIINPSIILGCGDWDKGSTEMFKAIYNEFPWYSTGVHGFVDVNDVARAAVMLMNSDIEAQQFIINGINISYENLFNKIANTFGVKPPHKKVTPFLAGLVWRMDYIKNIFSHKSSMITKHSATIALKNVQYDNSKLLKQYTDFQYTDLDKTIENICSCLQKRYKLK